LHVHLTSYIIEKESEDNIPAKGIKLIWPKDHNAYRRAAEKITGFAKEIEEKFGIELEYLDMGGGFPTVDGIGPYVDAITEPILSGFNQNTLPRLILEPGRAIVSDGVDLITTVVAVKVLPGGQRAVIVDAGINILPTSFWKYQELECFSEGTGKLEETLVYGPLCLQTDIISKTMLPDLKHGNLLRVKNVGAYNISQSSTFIYTQPPVILKEDKNYKVIRNKEVAENLFKT
jgi:diaminopimelate decarboxylase